MKYAPKFTTALCALFLALAPCLPQTFAADDARPKTKQSAPKKTSDKKGVPAKKSDGKSSGKKSSDKKTGTAKKSDDKDEKKAVPTGGEWGDPLKLQRRIAQNVAKNFKTWSPAELEKFFKDEDNLKDLAKWELLRALQEDEEEFKDFKMSVKKSNTRRFLGEFSDDLEWIEGYIYTAPPKNANFAIKLLRAFVEKDEEVKTVPVIKKIATGVVGEFSRRGWFEDEFETDPELKVKNGPTRIYKRFKFYAESWREKRLNPLFDELDFWDTRIIVGVTGRTNNIYFGSEESLRWGQDNVKLPEAGYASPRDIFQMPYRLWNKVGDSVHNSDYYAPFMTWYGRNQLKRAREVGCVCGGVSHYGASAACANGIPAVTMGEPGHCAFATRQKGKWRDNNSVSWDRSLHWRLWDETSWQFLHLTQEIYADNKLAMKAFRAGTLARIVASEKKKPTPDRVLEIYEYALKEQPVNFPIWREYLEFAQAQKKDKAFWKEAHKRIIDAYVPAFPDVAATLLGKNVYPNLLPLIDNDDEKIALYTAFWEKVNDFGAGRWDCESQWEYEVRTLGDGSGAESYKAFRKNYNAKEPVAPPNDGAKARYKEKVGALVSAKKDYGQNFENWKKGTPRK